MAQKKSIDDESVLEKALLVISEQGPEKFTLADVGKAVGLAPATLMQRFGSKRNLLILAAKQANVKLRSDLEELKQKKLPWDQELVHLLSAMPEGFGSRQDIANSLGVLKLDMIDPELHPIARHLFESLRQRIQELIQEGQSSKQLDQSYPQTLNFDSQETKQIEALRSERRSPSPSGKGEEDQFDKVAASQNSKFEGDFGIDSSFDASIISWELDALRHGLVIQWTLSGKGTLQEWLKNGFNHYFKRIKR